MIAIDIAILPPPAIAARAIELSARLPEQDFQGLRLGEHALPHITLTQHFVRADSVEQVIERVAETIRGEPPFRLTVAGAGGGQGAVWMSIDRTPELVDLHVRLMDALAAFEQTGGTEEAFLGGGRPRDVDWVTAFRSRSSYSAFDPHITLGHAAEPPAVEPAVFDATTIAVCHLGRFCTCARALRQWDLR